MNPNAIETHLIDVVALICNSFGLNPGEPTPAVPAGACLRSRVHLDGTFSGDVAIRCSPLLARRIASAMFGSLADDVSDDDAQDATHELANMIAGNLKSALGETLNLSIPDVPNPGESGIYAAMGPLALVTIPIEDGSITAAVLRRHLSDF